MSGIEINTVFQFRGNLKSVEFELRKIMCKNNLRNRSLQQSEAKVEAQPTTGSVSKVNNVLFVLSLNFLQMSALSGSPTPAKALSSKPFPRPSQR